MPFLPCFLINIPRNIYPLPVHIMCYSINPNAGLFFRKFPGGCSTTLWSFFIKVMQYSEQFIGSFSNNSRWKLSYGTIISAIIPKLTKSSRKWIHRYTVFLVYWSDRLPNHLLVRRIHPQRPSSCLHRILTAWFANIGDVIGVSNPMNKPDPE